MGRLSTLMLARAARAFVLGVGILAVGGACDPAPSSVSKERTNGVAGRPAPSGSQVAPKGVVAPAQPKAAPAATEAVAPKRAHAICSEKPEPLEPGSIAEGRAADGSDAPPALKLGRRWVWINVWAAWCEPCKKEMPMLLAWRDKLKASGVDITLAFVSIDDDERELTRFLTKQPANGVRSSWWLPADDERQHWFASIGYEAEPTLPVHAFVSPSGTLSCLVDGVLDTTDFPALQRLLKKR